jgi:hypothetical protein
MHFLFYMLGLYVHQGKAKRHILHHCYYPVGKLGPLVNLWWMFDVLSCMLLRNPDLFSCFSFQSILHPYNAYM